MTVINRRNVAAMLLACAVSTGALSPGFAQGHDYVYYSNQATEYYNAGELTKAIEMFERALPLAQDISIPAVYNNVAATYMKRGNYFHSKMSDDEKALSDMRMACYYMIYGWPEGVEKKPLHKDNEGIARDNLNIYYRNLQINPADREKHMELARQLRLQGKFAEAIVEFGQAADLDSSAQEARKGEALKAMGDLFNVLNRPHKSKKYYKLAAKTLGNEAPDDLLVQLGNASYKAGDINDAVVQYNKALEANPGNEAALVQLEKIWLNEIKFNPQSVLGHANLAGVYQKRKKYEEALQQYKAAEYFASNNPSTQFEVKKLIRLNIGTLFQEKKQYQLALKAYDTVLQVEPNNVLANYYKATIYKDTGNYPAAFEAYNRVLSLQPDHEQAQADLLAMIQRLPTPEQVAQELKNYGDRFAANALVQTRVGEEFHEMKDYENAAVYYQRAIKLNPDMAAAHANLGAAYQALGREEDSLAAYQRARELNPDNETVQRLLKAAEESVGFKHYQQAVEYQQQGETELAAAEFEKALEIAPENPDILAAYGVSLQNGGKLDDAIHHYQKAIALKDGDATFHYYLGTAFHQKNMLDRARQQYEKALALNPEMAEAADAITLLAEQEAGNKLQEAVTAFNSKRYPQALSLINQTLGANPDNAMAHYYKGLILNAQNRKAEAVDSYRQAVLLNPDFGDAYYALAILLDEKNDKVGARRAFEKFVSLSQGENDFVRYAQERLADL